MACWMSAYPSAGVAHATTRRPGVCANNASLDSLWCSTAPMPPAHGTRMTIGSVRSPPERARILASWLTIWSNAG